ncbi:unnamed protein product [Gongylonema pulchrum]|uniref:WD_REPEATS_REGION domain-containing protein n=1 Tax=Gongylonema pulchrum TaxID=637853 RepID=A0A183DNA7_9BILA|nr:unnamed protein product [Gongylonema pulchrum]
MFYDFGPMVAATSANSVSLAIPTNTGISRPSGTSSIESAPPPTPTVAPSAPTTVPKRRQIYRFTSNRPLFAAGWSSKTNPEKRWRIAVGSVVEEKPHNNRVCQTACSWCCSHENDAKRVSIVQLDEQQGELNNVYPDLLATSGECLKIYRVEANSVMVECIMNNKQASNFSGPLTNFDWNDVDPSLIGTSSIDMSCTIWQLETGQALAQTKKTSGSVKTQLIAHDRPVHDIKFSKINNGRDNFATVGADGSARLFDLRNLQHSTIVYEDPLRSPLMRLAWNKQDSHYLATFAQDSAEVVIVDIRMPCSPVARLHNHRACVNGVAWAPHSACHICTAGDDHQALIWDISAMPRPVEDPILAYQAGGEVNQVHWSASHIDWICICFGKCLEILRV